MAQIFYSDFNSAADDAQWGTLPTGWNDDYATSPAPLEGVESVKAQTSGGGAVHISGAFTEQTTGTTYARIAFRQIANGDSVGEAIWINFYNASDVIVARAVLRWSTTVPDFYRIYAHDSATNTTTVASPAVLFNDATYYLYLTYNRGASVVAVVKDSAGTQVSNYSVTRTTAESNGVAKIGVGGGVALNFIFDKVEVRDDTNWAAAGTSILRQMMQHHGG